MRQISFRLKPGQFLKEEIEKMVVDRGIRAGVLLSIVGGIENAVLRMAGSMPGNNVIKTWDGPFEIVSGTGTISDEGCHIHVSLSDLEGQVIGGHLKDGCRVASTAEIVIGAFDDAYFHRRPDSETGYSELFIEPADRPS